MNHHDQPFLYAFEVTEMVLAFHWAEKLGLLTTDWAQWSLFPEQINSNPLEAFTKVAGIRPLIKFPEPKRNKAASDTPASLILFMLEDRWHKQAAER